MNGYIVVDAETDREVAFFERDDDAFEYLDGLDDGSGRYGIDAVLLSDALDPETTVNLPDQPDQPDQPDPWLAAINDRRLRFPDESPTYRYPHKCLNCSLHFNVYSWDPEWLQKRSAYCPECGHNPAFPFQPEQHPEPVRYFVYDSVPAEVEEWLRAQLAEGGQ